MPGEYSIFMNGLWFDHLGADYGDRPEPSRLHQQTLWTIYELMKLGTHEIAIVNTDKGCYRLVS
jgi:hypothetical protein